MNRNALYLCRRCNRMGSEAARAAILPRVAVYNGAPMTASGTCPLLARLETMRRRIAYKQSKTATVSAPLHMLAGRPDTVINRLWSISTSIRSQPVDRLLHLFDVGCQRIDASHKRIFLRRMIAVFDQSDLEIYSAFCAERANSIE